MRRNGRYVLVCLILAVAGFVVHYPHPLAPGVRQVGDIPLAVGTWRMVRQATFDESTMGVLRPTSYVYRRYANGNGRLVDFYIGYHDGNQQAGGVHSPRQCLPGGGWRELSAERTVVAVGQDEVSLVKAEYRHDEVSMLFLYWFQVGRMTLASEYSLKAAEFLDMIRNGARSTALVRISTPMDDDGDGAYDAAVSFVRDFLPFIRAYIPA